MAAISRSPGETIADPFSRTCELRALLELRAPSSPARSGTRARGLCPAPNPAPAGAPSPGAAAPAAPLRPGRAPASVLLERRHRQAGAARAAPSRARPAPWPVQTIAWPDCGSGPRTRSRRRRDAGDHPGERLRDVVEGVVVVVENDHPPVATQPRAGTCGAGTLDRLRGHAAVVPSPSGLPGIAYSGRLRFGPSLNASKVATIRLLELLRLPRPTSTLRPST